VKGKKMATDEIDTRKAAGAERNRDPELESALEVLERKEMVERRTDDDGEVFWRLTQFGDYFFNGSPYPSQTAPEGDDPLDWLD
jgi:hypothetical protein